MKKLLQFLHIIPADKQQKIKMLFPMTVNVTKKMILDGIPHIYTSGTKCIGANVLVAALGANVELLDKDKHSIFPEHINDPYFRWGLTNGEIMVDGRSINVKSIDYNGNLVDMTELEEPTVVTLILN